MRSLLTNQSFVSQRSFFKKRTQPAHAMNDSAADPHANSISINENSQPSSSQCQIPIEIITEEEMALIEAAFTAAITSHFAAAAASYSSIPSSSVQLLQGKARSIHSITTHLSKKFINGSVDQDVEDLGNMRRRTQNQKRKKMADSLLHRFRRCRGLAVTDLTSTEWCEKQMEFKLLLGSTPATKAMKVGRDRHLILEKEVVKKVKFRPMSVEDSWAKKLINSIICANQLLSDGLTRELHLISMVSGVWMVGIIDEIRVLGDASQRRSMLVDTKTRTRKTLPSEEQTRNGMFQLMCYKYLWDKSVSSGFPSKEFFEFFSLNPHHLLPEEIRNITVEHGFPAETLMDIVRHYQKTCSTLPLAEEMLLLRYELQKDNTVIGEVRFEYDHKWVGEQIQACLEFWSGKREANVAPEDERWKCRICQFASVCPAQPHPIVDSSTSPDTLKSQEPVEK